MVARVHGVPPVPPPPFGTSGGAAPASPPPAASTPVSETAVLASTGAGPNRNCPNVATFKISANKRLSQGRGALNAYLNNPKETFAQIRTAGRQLADARDGWNALKRTLDEFATGWNNCLPPGGRWSEEASFEYEVFFRAAAALARDIEAGRGNSRSADVIASLLSQLDLGAVWTTTTASVFMGLLNAIAARLSPRGAF